MAGAEELKNILYGIIDEMAEKPWLFAKDPGRDFTRCRKLGFSTLLKFMLCMGGQSLNKELGQYFRCDGELMTKSAFVQQRDKLLPEAVEFLFSEFNERCDDMLTMSGYRVLAADASDLNIARDPHADSYIEKGNYNQIHVNALYDLLNQTYVDVDIQPRPKLDERRSLSRMLARSVGGQKTLVIADRGYDSFAMFETFNRTPGADYLIRIKNGGKNRLKALPLASLDIDMDFDIRTTQTKEDIALFKAGKATFVPPKATKDGGGKVRQGWPFESRCMVNVRIVRFQISEKDGLPIYETIATSLPRGAFPAEKIKKLYGMRWGVETSFRDLKYTLGLVNLHARKEEAAIMEVYSQMTVYNFCKRVVAGIRIERDSIRKHCYAVNFTMAVSICRSFLAGREIRGPDVEGAVSRYIEPVRPGRADKRKMMHKSFVPFIYRVA